MESSSGRSGGSGSNSQGRKNKLHPPPTVSAPPREFTVVNNHSENVEFSTLYPQTRSGNVGSNNNINMILPHASREPQGVEDGSNSGDTSSESSPSSPPRPLVNHRRFDDADDDLRPPSIPKLAPSIVRVDAPTTEKPPILATSDRTVTTTSMTTSISTATTMMTVSSDSTPIKTTKDHPVLTSPSVGHESNQSGKQRLLEGTGRRTNFPKRFEAKFQKDLGSEATLEESLALYGPKELLLERKFNTLHVALLENAPSEIVQRLLEGNPKMAQETDVDGNCPLIVGLLAGTNQEALEKVLDADEGSCSIINGNNECALHYAVQQQRHQQRLSYMFISRILRAYPEAASIQSLNEDEMPLHRLVALSPSQQQLQQQQRIDDSNDDGEFNRLVQEVINAHRKAARVRDQNGRTPLHMAISNRAPPETILAVFSAFPEAFGIKDAQGRNPRDEAKFGHIQIDLLRYMQEEYDDACCRRGVQVSEVLNQYKPDDRHASRLWNSLHLAMSRGASSEKIEVLLSSSPNMARKQNDAGNLPLLEGLAGMAGVQITMLVLQAYPDACRTPNKNGEFALHLASLSSPAVIIEAIVHIYPNVTTIRTMSGATPLHMLAGRPGAPPNRESMTLLKCQSALETRDANGDTPLHIAIKKKLPRSEIDFLFDSFQGAANLADKHSCFPLHSAIANELQEDQLISLLHAYPVATSLRYGEEGLLPLHMAMKYRSGGQFTSALIDMDRKAASIETKHGSTALSLALSYGADFDSVHTLLSLFPDAARLRNSEMMVPLHIAMMKGAPNAVVGLLLEAYPDAINVFNTEGHTPFHSGIAPAIHVLEERYPRSFQPPKVRGSLPLRRLVSRSEIGRGQTPLLDILSILDNLNLILDSYPSAAAQKDKTGYLPLLQFCMIFNPAILKFCPSDREEAAQAITKTLERLYRAFPSAVEMVGPFVGNPVNVLVGECSVATSVDELLADESCKRLKTLLGAARDGRALESLMCDLDSKVSLWAFFSLFDESGLLDSKNPSRKITVNMNKEVITGWSILDILADFDTHDSAQVLLQVVVEQKKKLEEKNKTFEIQNEDMDTVLMFESTEIVTEVVKLRVADRAKLSNSSVAVKQWGQEYGRFLRKYRLERQPKHVSETCIVVFGKESVKDEGGQMTEIDVALKFMTQRDTFLREVKKRKNSDSAFVVPIKATFSSIRIDEFDCAKVNLRAELAPYPKIAVNATTPKYVIVMECGAGYDLHDFISHQNVAGKDIATVTSIAKEIALCLKFLNEKCQIIHGDVKARNFVGRGVGSVGFAAIDLDNSSSIQKEEAGRKRTSSGYMPPEQARIEVYARAIGDDVSSGIVQQQLQKPKRVIATPAYDMWCFGVLLYFLCTGKQLFNVDTREDVDDDDLIRIRDWDDAWKNEKLSKVGTAWTEWVRLLDALLQKDPARRPQTWKDVIDEINTFGGEGKKKVYDRLVVFQSAPLGYNSLKKGGDMCSLPPLDFQRESAMLQEALKDAEELGRTIDVVFEAATLDRLRASMETRWGRVIHFSGHGSERYMAWENDRGLLERVNSETLRRLFSGKRKLMLVFISACHSEWVGRELVNQGVRHVVCCNVEELLLDTAAHEFTRSFYRALACGGTLLDAFTRAKEAVRSSSDVENSQKEADKFLLLPEKPLNKSFEEYHSQQVFFTEEVPRILRHTITETLVAGVPKPKDIVVGRNMEQYSILENFVSDKNADVVRVHGEDSCGKTTIVAALCDRMLLRPRVHPLDYLLWFPSRSSSSTAFLLYQQMGEILRLTLEGDASKQGQLDTLWRDIGAILADKKLLIVLDTRADLGWGIDDSNGDEDTMRRFHIFVQNLLQMYTIASCKVILISRHVFAGTTKNSLWREESVPVFPLEYDEAAEMFARSVQIVNRHKFPILGRPDDLVELFYPPNDDDDESNQAKMDELFERFLGEGRPGTCRRVAQRLEEEEIVELLNWWGEEAEAKEESVEAEAVDHGMVVTAAHSLATIGSPYDQAQMPLDIPEDDLFL